MDKRTTVVIEIHYLSNENRIYRKGLFPLKGRIPEAVAADFFRWIQREMPYGAELETAICEGEDITAAVRILLDIQKEQL